MLELINATMKMDILGVKIDIIRLSEVLAWIDKTLGGQSQNLIATVNPEFILAAQQDRDFLDALNNAGLATADGFGLILAGLVLHQEKLHRVTGVDLCANLLTGSCPNAKIYLLGGREGVALAVRSKYLNDRIVGAESGGYLTDSGAELEDNADVINRINASGANLLLVAFGQVRQEMWIKNNLSKMPAVKVAIGVGGTFDYLSGSAKRAPQWIRSIGFEWLIRLINEPRRFGRIWNATAGFSWLVLKDLFLNKN